MAEPQRPEARDPVLGVLGGMGPASTARFLQSLAHLHPGVTDQQHPRLVLLSEPGIPDRNQAILDGSDAPLAGIRDGLHRLVAWGANLLAVPCNTAHYYIDRIAYELPAPVVHIVDATLADAAARSPRGAWLCATSGTVACGIYQQRALRRHYPLLVPGAGLQTRLQLAITDIKRNAVTAAADTLRGCAAELWSHRDLMIINACTELALCWERADLPEDRAVSSIDALASACLSAIGTYCETTDIGRIAPSDRRGDGRADYAPSPFEAGR